MKYVLFTLIFLISLGMPVIVYNSRNELPNITKIGLLSYGLAMILFDISRVLQGLPDL